LGIVNSLLFLVIPEEGLMPEMACFTFILEQKVNIPDSDSYSLFCSTQGSQPPD